MSFTLNAMEEYSVGDTREDGESGVEVCDDGERPVVSLQWRNRIIEMGFLEREATLDELMKRYYNKKFVGWINEEHQMVFLKAYGSLIGPLDRHSSMKNICFENALFLDEDVNLVLKSEHLNSLSPDSYIELTDFQKVCALEKKRLGNQSSDVNFYDDNKNIVCKLNIPVLSNGRKIKELLSEKMNVPVSQLKVHYFAYWRQIKRELFDGDIYYWHSKCDIFRDNLFKVSVVKAEDVDSLKYIFHHFDIEKLRGKVSKLSSYQIQKFRNSCFDYLIYHSKWLTLHQEKRRIMTFLQMWSYLIRSAVLDFRVLGKMPEVLNEKDLPQGCKEGLKVLLDRAGVTTLNG